MTKTVINESFRVLFAAGCFVMMLTGILMMLNVRTCDAQALPMPKTGTCPSGYTTSGGFCSPMSDAKHALPKGSSQCPSGYMQSGAYCLKMQ